MASRVRMAWAVFAVVALLLLGGLQIWGAYATRGLVIEATHAVDSTTDIEGEKARQEVIGKRIEN
ncbi:hypothetical protein LJR225_003726 [Phenylobacterium sp. LjRoot225]|uniref:hypothetical protein n=1 Tax=Phenylobacterium sp. LjRoot225 TaxID=3342285 RepID=UPI003ECFC569